MPCGNGSPAIPEQFTIRVLLIHALTDYAANYRHYNWLMHVDILSDTVPGEETSWVAKRKRWQASRT
jgi:hypothetical protein